MFKPQSLVQVKEGGPLLDYVEYVRRNEDLNIYSQIAHKKRLMYLVLRTPELSGMLWDIAEDIVGKHDFVPMPGSRGNGRNRVINAKQWTRYSEFSDQLLAEVFDALATGEGYSYLGANAVQIQKQIARITSLTVKDRLIDEAVFNPHFRSISSKTMTNLHDESKLTGYKQVIHGNETRFSPEEIIHIYFKRMAGKIDGFSPVSTIPLQLELLWLLWSNQYDLQAKGNMPDMVVVAEEIRSNTPALKEVESKLRKYNMPGQAKHGTTLLYGGKYTFEKMERDTGLQFEDVGKAITSVIAGIFRYPKHRLGVKTKESASDKDGQGNADRDYWDMISKYQDKLSYIFDSQLFEPFFGVNLVFDKSYKHDTVVEGNAMQLRLGNVQKLNSLLMRHGERLTKDDIIRFTRGKDVDFMTEKVPEDDILMQQQNNFGVGSPEKPKDEGHAQERRKSELDREKNTGKPIGV